MWLFWAVFLLSSKNVTQSVDYFMKSKDSLISVSIPLALIKCCIRLVRCIAKTWISFSKKGMLIATTISIQKRKKWFKHLPSTISFLHLRVPSFTGLYHLWWLAFASQETLIPWANGLCITTMFGECQFENERKRKQKQKKMISWFWIETFAGYHLHWTHQLDIPAWISFNRCLVGRQQLF